MLSSVTFFLGLRAFRQRERIKYRRLMADHSNCWVLTFMVLQVLGFWQLFHTQRRLR